MEDASARPSLEAELERYLAARLRHSSAPASPADPPSLFQELPLDDSHFLCGVSQVAIGADTIFTRACRTAGIPQAILLPQHVDTYLDATGGDGRRDFPDEHSGHALDLLQSEHIIERRIASEASSRAERFEDTNRRIIEYSDLIICVVADSQGGKAGGTLDLLSVASESGLAALEIRVRLFEGRLQTSEVWHNRERFRRPALPAPLERLEVEPTDPGLPDIGTFVEVVKRHSSDSATESRRLFEYGARVIIGTHIGATVLATAVLAGHGDSDHATSLLSWSVILLALELLLLAIGLRRHIKMEHAKPEHTWALARLLAETYRSIRSLGRLHIPLDYLFRLRLPTELRDLLRTLNVLHLRATRSDEMPWPEQRDAYVAYRLEDPDPVKGQIAYYKRQLASESNRLRTANGLFLLSAVAALVATAWKLAILSGAPLVVPGTEPWLAAVLGACAIVMPVLAFGALSWSAAQDYAARVTTFGEMIRSLEDCRARLKRASSKRQFHELVNETELRLLGETADWYSRRRFRTVA